MQKKTGPPARKTLPGGTSRLTQINNRAPLNNCVPTKYFKDALTILKPFEQN
jgi:hypothetical protein